MNGTFNWALKQMKEGAYIRSESTLNLGYFLYYDYIINSIIVAEGTFERTVNCYVFATEYEYRLKQTSDFYVTSTKVVHLRDTEFIEHFEESFQTGFLHTRAAVKV